MTARSRAAAWMVGVVCVLIVCAPVLSGHWVGGHEGYSSLWRGAEVQAQLGLGTLWPRWCPDFYWGFGYPFFVFYPPGVYVAAALLATVSPAGLPLAFGVVAMVGCALLFAGALRLARLFVGDVAAVASAALTSLATYRFVQLWVRGDVPESVATAGLPWVIAEAVVLGRGGSRGAMTAAGARLAMGVALMSLTHTLSAVMACGALAAMGLGGLAMSRDWRAFVRISAGSLGGLVLSAGYWLPVAVRAPLARFGDMVDPSAGGAYLWSEHFPTVLQRFALAFGFGGSVPGAGDGMSLATSPVGWAVVAAATLAVRGERRLVIPLAAWAGVQALMLPVSSPLWEWVPGLRMFQFPWRFLALDAVLVGLIGGLVVQRLAERSRGAAPAVVLLAVVAAMPAGAAVWGEAVSEPFPLGPAAVDAMRDPSKLQTLGAFSAASLHIPLTTTMQDEYLPRTVAEPPRQHPASQGAPALPRDLGPAREQRGAWRRWAVRVPEDGRWQVSWFAFPGVRASVDGVRSEVQLGPRGVVELDLAAGDRVVDVWYAPSWDQRAGVWLGGLGWLLALGAWIRGRREG